MTLMITKRQQNRKVINSTLLVGYFDP